MKEGETRKFQKVVEESNIGIQKVCTIKEFQDYNKNKLKQALNEHDLILMDSRLNILKAAK